MFSGGGVAEWFRVLDSKSGSRWFNSSLPPLRSGFVLGSPEFNSSASAFCKQQLVSLGSVRILDGLCL